mgnify:CR=1 FL=1
MQQLYKKKIVQPLCNDVSTLPYTSCIINCFQVLQDVTKDEFIYIMEVLKSVPSMNTVQGRQQLLDIVRDQAELNTSFEASDSDVVDRLMSCVKQASPLFSVCIIIW